MPIYKVQVKGDAHVRLVKAASAAKARDHIVDAESVNAEEMAALIEAGAKLEKADETPAAPEPDSGAKS